jgi:hypothetical protein
MRDQRSDVVLARLLCPYVTKFARFGEKARDTVCARAVRRVRLPSSSIQCDSIERM